jgi:hypothetical protein
MAGGKGYYTTVPECKSDNPMAKTVLLYYLFLFSTAGLVLSLVFLRDVAWLMPALMMAGLIMGTNLVVIILKLHS